MGQWLVKTCNNMLDMGVLLVESRGAYSAYKLICLSSRDEQHYIVKMQNIKYIIMIMVLILKLYTSTETINFHFNVKFNVT